MGVAGILNLGPTIREPDDISRDRDDPKALAERTMTVIGQGEYTARSEGDRRRTVQHSGTPAQRAEQYRVGAARLREEAAIVPSELLSRQLEELARQHERLATHAEREDDPPPAENGASGARPHLNI